MQGGTEFFQTGKVRRRTIMTLTAGGIGKQFLRKKGGTNVFTAVEGADLSLESGTLTVLIGRSGSGKSTLLNMLSGLLSPDSGKVLLDGRDIYQMSDPELSAIRNSEFGVVPQGQTALMSLNVLENVLMPYSILKRNKKKTGNDAEAEAYARELLRRLEIDELAEAMPSELSGGEMRRMAIARALLNRPAFIFADEPTEDLDTENTRSVMSIFRAMADGGTAVLVVTHDQEVPEYADRVLRMEKGVLTDNIVKDKE